MAIITVRQLAAIRRRHADKKIVFCSGVFDLTHAGHALFFEDCKRLGDILVVSIGKDGDIRKYKGSGRPILNQHIRLKMVDALKPVDYCLFGSSVKKEDLIMSMRNMLMRLRPDIYAVNDDAFDMFTRRQLARACGTKLVICRRTCPIEFDGISTTRIIEKIKNLKKTSA